jgi:hypothetical protein
MSNQLEKEFEALYKSIGQEIEKKISQAEKLFQEAVELADKFGVPFQTSIFNDQRSFYVPTSFGERFAALDKEFAMDITDIGQYRLGNARGWTHSQIC